jgi:hypothetical protein
MARDHYYSSGFLLSCAGLEAGHTQIKEFYFASLLPVLYLRALVQEPELEYLITLGGLYDRIQANYLK